MDEKPTSSQVVVLRCVQRAEHAELSIVVMSPGQFRGRNLRYLSSPNFVATLHAWYRGEVTHGDFSSNANMCDAVREMEAMEIIRKAQAIKILASEGIHGNRGKAPKEPRLSSGEPNQTKAVVRLSGANHLKNAAAIWEESDSSLSLEHETEDANHTKPTG